MSYNDSLKELMEVVRTLRSEQGCPWDKKQTHESLKPYLLEETYEVIEAINQCDIENLREELGDILLQVALHSVIAEEQKEFSIDEVVHEVSEKMIRRHPHVFGLSDENSENGVAVQWEEIKQKEHNETTIGESLKKISKAMPASMRATKIQKKVSKAGFNLENEEQCFELIENTRKKLQYCCESKEKTGIDNAYGELLFAVLNLSTILGVNAENSLTNEVDKFINRFVGIERVASRKGKRLSELSINCENELWKLNRNKNKD